MKKFIILLLSSFLFLAACGNDDSNGSKDDSSANKDSSKSDDASKSKDSKSDKDSDKKSDDKSDSKSDTILIVVLMTGTILVQIQSTTPMITGLVTLIQMVLIIKRW